MKTKKKAIFLAACVGIVSISLAAGGIYLFRKPNAGSGLQIDKSFDPGQAGWEELNENKPDLSLDEDAAGTDTSDRLVDKLRRLTDGGVITAYAVSGDQDYIPETDQSTFTTTKKTAPASKPVITDISDSERTVHASASGKPELGNRVEIPLDPVPTAPPPAAGSVPRMDEWAGHNDLVPQQLYEYPYTQIGGYETITGAQIKFNGYTDMDAATAAVKTAMELRYNVNYNDLGSTDVKARDAYLCKIIHYCGETSQYNIAAYMDECKNNKVISQAEFITDKSLLYSSAHNVVRGRLQIKYESGAEAYGLKNGIWYYRDMEVGVRKDNKEDRYGYGPKNDYLCLMFIAGGNVDLSGGFHPMGGIQ